MLRKKNIIILLVLVIIYFSYHHLTVKHYSAYLSFNFGKGSIYITDMYLQDCTLSSLSKWVYKCKDKKQLTLHGIVINPGSDSSINTQSNNSFSISIVDKYSNNFSEVNLYELNKDKRSNMATFSLSGIIPEEEILGIVIRDNRTGNYQKAFIKPQWQISSLKMSRNYQPQRFIYDLIKHINKKNNPWINKHILESHDYSLLKNLIHDYWHTSPWESYITYQEEYGDFKDVFVSHITFYKDHNQSDILAQQKIYLIVFRNDWLIIDVSPVTHH